MFHTHTLFALLADNFNKNFAKLQFLTTLFIVVDDYSSKVTFLTAAAGPNTVIVVLEEKSSEMLGILS